MNRKELGELADRMLDEADAIIGADDSTGLPITDPGMESFSDKDAEQFFLELHRLHAAARQYRSERARLKAQIEMVRQDRPGFQ